MLCRIYLEVCLERERERERETNFPEITCPYIFSQEERDENGNIVCMIMKNGKKKFFPQFDGLNISFIGRNNTFIFHEGTNFKNVSACLADNCLIIIQETLTTLLNISIQSITSSGTLYIGNNFTCSGAVILFSENKKIYIGDDCMFSNNIVIRVGDGHAIFNDKNELINEGKNVYIGNHVWIAGGVRIEKGSHIADNSIVGENALVTKKFFEQNVIIAGIPAKVIKRDIRWDRQNPKFFYNKQS